MEKSHVDDNVSSSDQISHGLSSSTGENKTSMKSQRDADFSTLSSERVQSEQQTSIRSDVSSETGQPFNKDTNDIVADRAEEVSKGDPTMKASYHYEQHKAELLSSKESCEVVRLNSVEPKPCLSSNKNSAEDNSHSREGNCGFPTQSDESKNIQEPISSVTTTKSDTVSASVHSPHQFKFDLNEDMEADGAEFPDESFREVKSLVHHAPVAEPIPVVAKVGVPIGLPRKPLQFGGELGWRTSRTTSAFQPTSLGNSHREKGGCDNLDDCGSRQSLLSQGIDLNVSAAVDSELPVVDTSVDASSKGPKRFLLDLNCQSDNDENVRKAGALSFDLNDNYVNEDTRKSICRPGESQQLSRNCNVDAAARSGGNGSTTFLKTDYRLPPQWVDMSSVRGFSNVQTQPFLVAAPTAEQVRMVVPLQSQISFLPHGSSGLYIGKINGLSPTLYPPTVLPHLNNQHGAAVFPQISGPVLAAYPGPVHVLDTPQGLSPSPYASIRPTFLQNGSLALMENGSRGANNYEFLVPTRNTLFEERMKPVEQVAFPASSAKRREPEGGWESAQTSYRQMASRN